MLWDLRYSIRTLARRPAFAALVIITLALGVGSATAVFGLVDAVLLHPIRIREPGAVVSVYQVGKARNPLAPTAYGDFNDLQSQVRSLSGLAAYYVTDVVVDPGVPEQVAAGLVSPNYFDVLHPTVVAGRLWSAAEAAETRAPVVVLSSAYWHRVFGADPRAIGRRIIIAGINCTVVGVTTPDFRGTDLSTAPDIWVPVTALVGSNLASFGGDDALNNRILPYFQLVGRLAPGASREKAGAELTMLMARVRSAHPLLAGIPRVQRQVLTEPIAQAAAGRDRGSLVDFVELLVGVVILILMLACANVANLFIVRDAERLGELSVRAALGAPRRVLVAHLIGESLLLALLGAAVGLIVADVTMRIVSHFALPGHVALAWVRMSVDARVVFFAIALAMAAALLAGIWPAWRITRPQLVQTLNSRSSRFAASRKREALLGLQVAVSTVLLIGSLLFLRSLQVGLSTDIGFDYDGLSAVTVSPAIQHATPARSLAIYGDILAEARRIRRVTKVALSTHVPLEPLFTLPFIPLNSTDFVEGSRQIGFVRVSSGFFSLLAVPLIQGRDFEPADGLRADKLAIVNQSAATTYWPGQSAVGKRLALFGAAQYTIIGVARDTKYRSLSDGGTPVAYAFIDQDPPLSHVTVLTRSADPAGALRELESVVRHVDHGLPPLDPRTVADQVDRVLMPQRFGATLLTLFAGVAVVICMVGVYGTIAYVVSHRTSEIGIRRALGARGSDIVRVVLGGTTLAVGGGAALGLAGAVGGSRAVAHFLYGISPLDPGAFLMGVILLAAAASLVAVAPIGRALSIDPIRAIREHEF